MRPVPGAGVGGRVVIAKVLPQFHPEAAEDVVALVAVRDGACPPPGVAGRDLDDGALASRGEHRVDLGRVRLALQAQDPPHDVDAPGVPAGVDSETGRAADGGRFPRRRGLGDALLDIGVRRELAGLVSGFRRSEAPGAGQDGHGERLEVAEGAPRRPGVVKRAGLVSRVDAHRFLPRGRLAERRGTRSPVSGLPLPLRPRPRGVGNVRRRRWKPRCCGTGTGGGTCPEPAGYARKGECAVMGAAAEAPSRRGKRRPRGRGSDIVARSRDWRNRQ